MYFLSIMLNIVFSICHRMKEKTKFALFYLFKLIYCLSNILSRQIMNKKIKALSYRLYSVRKESKYLLLTPLNSTCIRFTYLFSIEVLSN
jgi:hypothetical protein